MTEADQDFHADGHAILQAHDRLEAAFDIFWAEADGDVGGGQLWIGGAGRRALGQYGAQVGRAHRGGDALAGGETVGVAKQDQFDLGSRIRRR